MTDEGQHAPRVSRLYDEIGSGYDESRRADPAIAARLAMLLDTPPRARCLDVACGTGSYTMAVAGHGGHWVGADVSTRMLATARAKSHDAAETDVGRGIGWVVGDVHSLPFASGAFDRAMCTLAVHHFADLEGALAEIARVLGDGRAAFFTSAPSQMRGYWLNEYFPDAMVRSMAVMPELSQFADLLATVGFTDIRIERWDVPPTLQDRFLYSGKHKPELYLSETFRAGISTFAQHADPAEVEHGCEQLRADLEDGRFGTVRAAYANDGGDYAFVVAVCA